MKRYFIDKSSGTSADALLAVGFAKLVEIVQERVGKQSGIVIQDAGSYYIVESTVTVKSDDMQYLKPFALVRPLNMPPKKKEDMPEKQSKRIERISFKNGFDYEAQKAISENYYALLKKMKGVPDAKAKIAEKDKPDPLLEHYRIIAQMIIADPFNTLTQLWMALGELQRDYIEVLFTLFSTPDNDVEGSLKSFQSLAKMANLESDIARSALQIVNPAAGMGANRAKANSVVNPVNLKSLWPLELLKFVGFMIISAPYVIQGSKDRKTYVLQPRRIRLSTLESIMKKFRASCWSSTAVKLDVMASLRFAEAFLEHHSVFLKETQPQEDDDDEPFDESQVTSVAHGFDVVLYKEMGNAFATMNISTINFPQWLRIETLEDAEKTLALLKEHRLILQNIRTGNREREEGAEEYALLRAYRDFLSGNDLSPFWTFTTAYSSYLISQREHEKNVKRWLRQLSITGLEQIIDMTTTTQTKPLTTIINNRGFQNIARAIRQSTVIAQRRRSQDKDRTYEVRYGLGQQLAREARYRDKFLNTLSDFLTNYNAETAREEEKVANKVGGPITFEQRKQYRLRGYVALEDINEIIKLMDEFDDEYEMVARLLIAYGYAKSRGNYEAHDSDENTLPSENDQGDDSTNLDEDNQ